MIVAGCPVVCVGVLGTMPPTSTTPKLHISMAPPQLWRSAGALPLAAQGVHEDPRAGTALGNGPRPRGLCGTPSYFGLPPSGVRALALLFNFSAEHPQFLHWALQPSMAKDGCLQTEMHTNSHVDRGIADLDSWLTSPTCNPAQQFAVVHASPQVRSMSCAHAPQQCRHVAGAGRMQGARALCCPGREWGGACSKDRRQNSTEHLQPLGIDASHGVDLGQCTCPALAIVGFTLYGSRFDWKPARECHRCRGCRTGRHARAPLPRGVRRLPRARRCRRRPASPSSPRPRG
jgi:hypothetical protein